VRRETLVSHSIAVYVQNCPSLIRITVSSVQRGLNRHGLGLQTGSVNPTARGRSRTTDAKIQKFKNYLNIRNNAVSAAHRPSSAVAMSPFVEQPVGRPGRNRDRGRCPCGFVGLASLRTDDSEHTIAHQQSRLAGTDDDPTRNRNSTVIKIEQSEKGIRPGPYRSNMPLLGSVTPHDQDRTVRLLPVRDASYRRP
jgi:hypothetical protein